MSLRKHLENFAQHTSMHGFGRIILTKKPEKRVAWVIVFVAAWALFTLQLTCVLSKYFEYSKKTTTVLVAGGAPFPAITLCNMQSLDFYALHKLLKFSEGSTSYSNDSSGESFRLNNSFAYHFLLLASVLNKYWSFKGKPDSELSELYAMFSRTSFAANLPKDVLDEVSIKKQEFIVKCTYGNSSCKFTEIPDPYFLKCFTFEPPNIRNTSFDSFQSWSEGIANGLSVTVFTGIRQTDNNDTIAWLPGVYEKSSPLSGSSGIRVVIHPPGTEPFPLTEGHDVPPGSQASIGIVPERRKRLGKPYGICARNNRYKSNSLDEWYGFETDQREPYRKISCERMCMQEEVIKNCKCFDETLPAIGNAHCYDDVCWLVDKNDTRSSDKQFQSVVACRSIASIKGCALDDSCNASMVADTLQNIRCANEVTNRLMTDLESLSKCNCYPPCDEFCYYTFYSLAKWPSAGYDSLHVRHEILGSGTFTHRFTEDKREMYKEYIKRSGMEAMNDFAKINVYITDSNVLEIAEEPATTITQLISDVGGQLGLWIGVSVITISEVIETILTIATAGFRKLYRKYKGSKTESDNNPSTKADEGEYKVQIGPSNV